VAHNATGERAAIVRYIEQQCNIVNETMASHIPRNPAPAEPPRVGDTLAALRQARALSLDELSRMAGVSKSMLSQIERAQANPTVAVVWRLANALGVPIGDLLDNATQRSAPAVTVVPLHATPTLRNPEGSSELRILGPLELAGRFEWYALSLQAGAALESEAHEVGTQEHLTVLSGAIEVVAGDARHRLKNGDTARYTGDRPHAIRNVGKTLASGWLVVVHPG